MRLTGYGFVRFHFASEHGQGEARYDRCRQEELHPCVRQIGDILIDVLVRRVTILQGGVGQNWRTQSS